MSALNFIYPVLRFFTMPVELFLRINFGERYINVFSFILPSIGFLVFHELSTPFTKEFMGVWIKVYFIILPIAGMFQLLLHKYFIENENAIHSYYSGVPLLFPKIKETLVKFYIEPLAVFAIGVIFYLISMDIYYEVYGFGIFLILSSILLFFRGQFEYNIQRSEWLDVQDEQIENTAMQDVLSKEDRKDAKHSQGYSIPGPLQGLDKNRKSMGQIFDKLNPKLKDLMNKKTTEKETVSKVTSKEKEKDREI